MLIAFLIMWFFEWTWMALMDRDAVIQLFTETHHVSFAVPLPRSSDVAHLPVHVWGVYAETIPTKVGGFYLTCHVSLNRQNAPPVSTLAEARWAFHRKIGQHIQERTLSHSIPKQVGRVGAL